MPESVDRFLREARKKAARRKSAWNIVLLVLCIPAVTIWGIAMGVGVLRIQSWMMPSDVVLSSYTRAGSILMFIPLFFPALGLGMVTANLLMWCIPPARRAFEREARGYRGASFRPATKRLVLLTGLLLILSAPVSALGVMNYFYVRDDGIHLNPLFSLKERHYRWDEVREVRTRCIAERKNLHLNFILLMADGTSVDLMEEPRMRFVRVFPRIKAFLDGVEGIGYSHEVTRRGIRRLVARYGMERARAVAGILYINGGPGTVLDR